LESAKLGIRKPDPEIFKILLEQLGVEGAETVFLDDIGTYYISYAGKDLVLRKKPPGKLLPSAHAVEREYRVMQAMKNASVPIPPLYSVLCEDPQCTWDSILHHGVCVW